MKLEALIVTLFLVFCLGLGYVVGKGQNKSGCGCGCGCQVQDVLDRDESCPVCCPRQHKSCPVSETLKPLPSTVPADPSTIVNTLPARPTCQCHCQCCQACRQPVGIVWTCDCKDCACCSHCPGKK
jgi:hypothetical protein